MKLKGSLWDMALRPKPILGFATPLEENQGSHVLDIVSTCSGDCSVFGDSHDVPEQLSPMHKENQRIREFPHLLKLMEKKTKKKRKTNKQGISH